MNEIYHGRANEYAKVIENNIYNALYDRPSLMSLIDSERFRNCLDVGCGPGAYIENLRTICSQITAIDSSQEFINIVATRYPELTYSPWINPGDS